MGSFATAVEQGDTERVISLLTGDAWLTMPPQPYEYQGPEAIAAFIVHERGERGRANLRLVPTRANGQPAFGCYLPDSQAARVRAYGLMVLTLTDDNVSAITWFGERALLQHFGLPRTLPDLKSPLNSSCASQPRPARACARRCREPLRSPRAESSSDSRGPASILTAAHGSVPTVR